MHDAARYARHAPFIPQARGAEWVPSIGDWWTASIPFNRDAATAPGQIFVFVNEGRWIAECPDCHGAQLACRSDHRFMCNFCGNIEAGGQWRRVAWPADPAALEVELERRPTRNQHWKPGETVDDLKAENAAHEV